MEAFPPSYVVPAHPLIVLSGLVPDASNISSPSLERTEHKISSESPNVSGDLARRVLNEFLKFEPPSDGEHTNQSNHAKPMYFRFKNCGRQYALPNRKSSPESVIESQIPPLTPTGPSSRTRSVLSPLSPGSPLYPDGIMTATWAQKYQDVVPALVVSFFPLSFENESKSLDDNRLKNEILAIRTSLGQSYNRIRYIVVITSHKSMTEEPEIEERLMNIKRTAKLDSKTGLSFLDPDLTAAELSTFVVELLTDVRLLCLEFYREMIKHTRKKRDRRGTSAQLFSPVDESTKLLGKAGWTARDEFKLGFLSEFCLEIDAANRHYNTAWEALFAFGGVFDTVSPSSPRWYEHFEFGSILAIRFVRCLFAAGLPTSAVRFWKKHQQQLSRLRQENKIQRYSKNAEMMWTRAMAQLTREIPDVAMDSNARKSIDNIAQNKKNVYASIERSLANDVLIRPWEHLHHTGYWLKYCATQASSGIDELPEDSFKLIAYSLEEAAAEFAGRGQARMSDRMKLELAHQLHLSTKYDAAFKILKLLWQRNSWRSSGWWPQVGKVTYAMYQCAKKLEDLSMQLIALWELSSRAFKYIPDLNYDIYNILNRNAIHDQVHIFQIRQETIESFLKLSFSFESSECHADEPINAQIQIGSSAHSMCQPVTISYIDIELEGSVSIIRLSHEHGSERTSSGQGLSDVRSTRLEKIAQEKALEKSPTMVGRCNLACAPGQFVIINMQLDLADAGELSAIKGLVALNGQVHSTQYSVDLRKNGNHASHWYQRNGVLPRRALQNANHLKILPKLPKAKIALANMLKTYYTDEMSTVEVEIENLEKDAIHAVLKLRVMNGIEKLTLLKWTAENGENDHLSAEVSQSIGVIEPSGKETSKSFKIQTPATELDATMHAEIVYAFTDNSSEKLTTSFTAAFQIVRPFEVKYRLCPTLHLDPWPSKFLLSKAFFQDEESCTDTIRTSWLLDTSITSTVEDNLDISLVELNVLGMTKGYHCKIHDATQLERDKSQHYKFIFDVLEEEFVSNTPIPNVNAELLIHWRRRNSPSDRQNISALPVSRLQFAIHEPRVFAQQLTPFANDTLLLEIIIENPSTHYLSFNVALEPEEEFGFSGPKLSTIHLVPFSRHSLKYTLLPLVKTKFIQPKVQVTDMYFNKILPINPVGDLSIDQKGILLWSS